MERTIEDPLSCEELAAEANFRPGSWSGCSGSTSGTRRQSIIRPSAWSGRAIFSVKPACRSCRSPWRAVSSRLPTSRRATASISVASPARSGDGPNLPQSRLPPWASTPPDRGDGPGGTVPLAFDVLTAVPASAFVPGAIGKRRNEPCRLDACRARMKAPGLVGQSAILLRSALILSARPLSRPGGSEGSRSRSGL